MGAPVWMGSLANTVLAMRSSGGGMISADVCSCKMLSSFSSSRSLFGYGEYSSENSDSLVHAFFCFLLTSLFNYFILSLIGSITDSCSLEDFLPIHEIHKIESKKKSYQGAVSGQKVRRLNHQESKHLILIMGFWRCYTWSARV